MAKALFQSRSNAEQPALAKNQMVFYVTCTSPPFFIK
jgi:hypothetical protein